MLVFLCLWVFVVAPFAEVPDVSVETVHPFLLGGVVSLAPLLPQLDGSWIGLFA